MAYWAFAGDCADPRPPRRQLAQRIQMSAISAAEVDAEHSVQQQLVTVESYRS